MISRLDNTPSDHLLKQVRAALVLQGLSFSEYCRRNDVVRQNVAAAISGRWTGPKAEEVVEKVLRDLGFPQC